jgi:hypothetical protein
MLERYLAAKSDKGKSPEAKERCRRNLAPLVEAQKHVRYEGGSRTASEGRGRAAGTCLREMCQGKAGTSSGGLPCGLRDVGRANGATWYLSRELVPLMPESLRRPRQCGYVIKRAFDYGLIEREELETKGRFETYWPYPNVRLLRRLPSYKYKLTRLAIAA